MNYEQDVEIDHTALDVEWIEQTELMRKYAKHAADMKREMDFAKERLDVGKAALDRQVRERPDKFGLEKITEAAVSNSILLQEKYQILNQEYIDARYEYDVAVAAVRAIDQRKTALENLVKLLTASYFAGPQAPRDLGREWAERQERRRLNANVRMMKRRKDG